MLYNLAVIHEIISEAIPEREALLWRDRRWTYRDFTLRTRRLAHALVKMGLGCHQDRQSLQPWESGQDHVALYLYNGNEYLEGFYGAFKARTVSININYRYVADELVYVLNNSRASAILYHSAFAPTLDAIRGRLPHLRHFIQVADDSGNGLLDGAVDYENLLAAQPDTPLDLCYSPDDLYILYTGGTTGMPKGVLWRHEDVFFNGLGGHIPGFPRIETKEQLLELIHMGIGGRFLIAFPFMHGAGQWAACNTFHRGGTIVLPDETRRLDPPSIWRAVQEKQVDQIGLIGDAFARPLLAELEKNKGAYDTSSVRMVMSTATVISPSVKKEFLSYMPENVMFLESIGGSELGIQAMRYGTQADGSLPSYELREGTVLLRQDRRGLLDREKAKKAAASSTEGVEVGWIASSGHLPLGYLGDPEKTKETFPIIDGVRFVVGGDRAYYDAEGRLVFLGRESMCINSGGEKVYVEEVERVVKSHPAIYDALVVGVPSERWGEEVTAVVSLKNGSMAPTLDELRRHCKTQLADYKVPKALITAPEIARLPNGKPDYKWAREYAVARRKDG